MSISGLIAVVGVVLSSTYAGSGQFTTVRGVYPLQELRYLRAASGRGGLQLMAGAGAIMLSGVQADEIAPGRLRLSIDRMEALTSYAAEAACDVRMSKAGAFLRLSCKGVLGPRREPFSVSWTAARRPSA